MNIRPLKPGDYDAVRAIYAEGIATQLATFQTATPEWAAWNAAHLPICRLVSVDGSRITGFAALSPYSSRPVYAGVAEVSIYIAEAARGQGVGKRLLNALIDDSEHNNIWTLQAGIFAENLPSIALHTACGFRIVGRRERLGQLYGVWHDVVLMERRSLKVGS